MYKDIVLTDCGPYQVPAFMGRVGECIDLRAIIENVITLDTESDEWAFIEKMCGGEIKKAKSIHVLRTMIWEE